MESPIIETVPSSSSTANPVQWDPLSKAIQNALVVDEISKYISISDLMNCRSASTLWKSEWTPVIQKRSNFQLCLTDRITMLIKDMKIGMNESPSSDCDWHKRAQIYFDCMDDSEIDTRYNLLIQWIIRNIPNFPCSKFRVETNAFNMVDESEQGNFFRAISNIATNLYLENSICNPTFYFTKSEDLVYRNLKIFEIKYKFLSFIKYDMALQFVGEVIQLAPNLDTLSIIQPSAGDSSSFFTTCISVVSNPKLIKTLRINGKITDNLLNKLTEKEFNLTELNMCFNISKKFPLKTFVSWLSSQGNSLKQLCLKHGYLGSQKIEITFPVLPLLEILEIDCVWQLGFPGLSLRESFPRLKHLKIIGDLQMISDLNPNAKIVPTLRELDLETFGATQNAFSEAYRVSPNIKRLSIPCMMSCMLALNAASMDSLEELWLLQDLKYINYITYEIGEVLTGFTETELQAAEQNGVLVEMERRPLSILQRVKILRLKNAALTDLMCILGPMKLQSLRCLDLRISSQEIKHQISETMLAKMREKFTVLL